MKDDDARYLIHQFNTYASWSTIRTGTMISVAPLSVTIFALGWSIASFGRATMNLLDGIMLSCVVGAVAVMVVFVVREGRRITDDHWRNREFLIALEEYRMRCKSLPDGITLRKVIQSKPDELEKLLKESEPITTDSPQT